MTRIFFFSIVCVSLLLGYSPQTRAEDDAIEFLKKAEEVSYLPQQNGVKSLSVDIHISTIPETGEFEDLSAKAYYKEPDKRATKTKGLPDDPQYEEFAEMLEELCEIVVPRTLDEEMEENEYEMEEDGDLVKITAIPKPGTKSAEDYKKIITWYGEDLLPVKAEVEDDEGTIINISDVEFKKKDDKYLFKSMSAVVETEDYGTLKIQWHRYYKELDGIWLISKFKRTTIFQSHQNATRSMVFTFENYEVNCDIDDEIFTEDAQEDEEGDEGEESDESDEADEEW